MNARMQEQPRIDLSLLPALPNVAREILTKFSDEFVSGEEVAAIVSKDPGMTARLVSIANSAYFALPTPVTDMTHIVIRVLGVDNVRALTLAIATSAIFKTSSERFDLRDYWLRAFFVAETCRRAASNNDDCTDVDKQLAYTTGFCSSIGWIALAALCPQQIDECVAAGATQRGAMSDDEIALLLQQRLDMTPNDATAELARHWKMPERICNAYDTRGDDTSTQPLSQALRLADSIWRYQLARQADEPESATDPEQPMLDAVMPTDRYQKKIDALVSTLVASSR